VPDALPLPPDLVQLQVERAAADTALAEYINEVERHRREQYPEPEQLVDRRTWSDDESAELERLRGTRDGLAEQIRQHPVMARALEERCWQETWGALQAAARE
jgi:hypothetical protein